jgi:molybdate/tungstate transport system substrate-binding protein
LGAQYDYSFTYQHNAYASSKQDSNYRYVNLPDKINLGNSDENRFYQRAVIVEPGLFGNGFVPLPATRVIWGATILKTAPNPANAIAFLQLLLGPTGQAALTEFGPAPITPAIVRYSDFHNLPSQLQNSGLVKTGEVFPEFW